MDCQDWNSVTIHNTAGRPQGSAPVPATPPKFTSEAGAARKLADADAPLKIKTFTPASRQEIVARRAAMKKSQVELNQLCSFPPNTIREIEAGRLAPTIGQLNTLNRILKTGLKLQ
jgi:ribosome-binding protein aMBF1 (putative translation factor)